MPTSNFHTAIELHRLDIDFTDYLVRLQTYIPYIIIEDIHFSIRRIYGYFFREEIFL